MEITSDEEESYRQESIKKYKTQTLKVGEEGFFLGKGMAPGIPIKIIYCGMPNKDTFALTHFRDEINVCLYYPSSFKKIEIFNDLRIHTSLKVLRVNPGEISLELIINKKSQREMNQEEM